MYGDLLTALLWAHGFDAEQCISGTGDQRTATCTITRRERKNHNAQHLLRGSHDTGLRAPYADRAGDRQDSDGPGSYGKSGA